MNKALLAATGLILTTALVAPKFITSKIEQQAQALVSTVNDWPYYQASLSDVDAGWFSYHARLKVEVDLPAMLADGQPANIAPLPLEFDIQSHQGPVLASGLGLSQFQITLAGDGFREQLVWDEQQAFYQMTGKLGLTGALSFEDKIAGFQYFNDKGQAEVAPYIGTAETVNGTLQYRGELAATSLKFNGSKAELNRIHWTANLYEPLANYVDQAQWHKSDIKLTIDKIDMARAGQQIMSMQTFEVSSNSNVDAQDRRGDMEIAYRLKQFIAGSIQGQDMELVLELANLDEAAFFGLNQVLADQSASQDPQFYADEHRNAIKQHLLALFQNQPELNIRSLKGSFPQGILEGQLTSKLVDVSDLPDDLEATEFWLTHIKADSHLKIGKELATALAEFFMMMELHKNPDFIALEAEQKEQIVTQQVANLLAMFEAQGTLKVEDEDYTLAFSLADGQANINGQSLPLGQ